MNQRAPIPRSLHEQRGLTMVELMVAITLGLILTTGLIQIFVNSKQIYRVEEALSRVQESGRLALELMANDIRMASYWGCQSNTDNIQNNLNPGAGFIDFTAGGVSGTEGGAGGTDTLTLRGADGTSGLTPQPNGGSGKYSPLTSAALKVNLPNDLNAGDILLLSDCTGGDVFQISSGNPSVSGTVVHNTGAGTPGNATDLSKVYQGDATLLFVREIIYSISNVGTSDGQPALWRSINGVNQEIVSDVSDMQVTYGEDMNGDRSVDRYVDAGGVADFGNVYSVKVRLTVMTAENNTSLTAGTRISRAFESTVTVRNRVL